MQKRRIGSLSVSLVGLGCNNFGIRLDQQRTSQVVAAALDAGIDFFDTADIYGGTHSEEFLGRALAGKRERAIIATKFGLPLDELRKGAKPEYIRRAVEDSLCRLGTDYIDLYQLHRPDPTVPIADTLGALDELVKQGKVREIGASNFDVLQIREAEATVARGAARFASLQNEYSLLERSVESDVLPECAARGIAFLPYFPLASGLLTGKYRAGVPAPEGTRLTEPESQLRNRFLSDAHVGTAEALAEFATERGHSLLDLAFSWLAARPEISSVIAGATSVAQVEANVRAVTWQLSADERGTVDRLARPQAP
jgi:aryl-alcohol dehydrogenase-like predicted oxidoreductase